MVKLDWQTKDEAHPGWAEVYRAVDVVGSVVYDIPSNIFGTDLDKVQQGSCYGASVVLGSRCTVILMTDCIRIA